MLRFRDFNLIKMRRISLLMVLVLLTFHGNAQSRQQILDFSFEGVNLSGILNLPETENRKGIVLPVHGDGKTDAVAGQ